MLTQAVYAIDRSLKTIGIIDAYPKYADLPGFAKYVFVVAMGINRLLGD